VSSFRYHPEALAEHVAAIGWYAERSDAAARHFVEAAERAVRRARALPRSCPRWPGELPADLEVRVLMLRHFPYVFVYLVEPDEIVVLAVAHTRSQPGYRRARLP
jgi:plasmid stabilization system protein ParE